MFSRTAVLKLYSQFLSAFFPPFCQKRILTLLLTIHPSLLTTQLNSVSVDARVNKKKQTHIVFNALILSALLFNSCQLVSEFFLSFLVRNVPSEKEKVTV